MTEQRITEELDLLAYADGHLDDDPIAKAAIEGRLRKSPQLAARARAYRAQTEALRRAYGRIQEPLPDRLLQVLERRPESYRRRAAVVAAMALLTILASVTGWLLGQSNRPGENAAQEFVSLSYENFVTSASGAQGVPAAQREPFNWLSQEISLNLRVPDLSNLGFAITDKRTVEGAEGRMVRLTYAASDGRSFKLFLKPRWNEQQRGLQMATERDVSIAYWLEGPLASAVASSLPPKETMAIAEAVQGALLDLNIAQPTIRPDPGPPAQQGTNLADSVHGTIPGSQPLGGAAAPGRPGAETISVSPN